MKLKIFLLLPLLLALPLNSFAAYNSEKEFYSHSVHAGVGFNPFNLIGSRGGLYGHSLLVSSIGYEYRPLKMLGICADVDYNMEEYRGGDEPHYKADEIFIFVGVRGIWYDKPHFSVYSKANIGLGVKFYREHIKSAEIVPWHSPGFNIIPVGMEFGGRRLRGYTELLGLGIGYAGFSLGVRYNF